MTLQDLRKKHNLKQRELAEIMGVSQASVAMWETGKARPKMTNFIALSKALDESIDACFAAMNETIANSR